MLHLAEELRAATLAHVDRVLAQADRLLSRPRAPERDPLVLLEACLEMLSEIAARVDTADDAGEKRLRLAHQVQRLEALEQMWNRTQLRMRDGIGLSEDSRAFAASLDREIRALRIVVAEWVSADKEAGRRERQTPGGLPE